MQALFVSLQVVFFVLQMPTRHPQNCASDAHKASAKLCFRCPPETGVFSAPSGCLLATGAASAFLGTSDAHFFYAASVSHQKPSRHPLFFGRFRCPHASALGCSFTDVFHPFFYGDDAAFFFRAALIFGG